MDDPGRTVNFVRSQRVAEYANGHLLVPQGPGMVARRLVAQRVSLPDGQLLGDPIDVGGIRVSETLGRFVTSTNAAGVVAILPPELPKGQLTWISRDGRILESIGAPEAQYGVELSPTGRERWFQMKSKLRFHWFTRWAPVARRISSSPTSPEWV